MAKKKKEEVLENIGNMKSLINKLAGGNVAHNEPTSSVKDWVSTGSRVLDSTIAKGKMAGIPVGRISSFAGLPSTGKSFLACQIASNALKSGYQVVYFDTEAAIDPGFLTQMDIDMDSGNFHYVQPLHVEMIFEIIEGILSSPDNKGTFFIWDSLANTPTKKEIEDGGVNPSASISLRPRIVGLGLRKITNRIMSTDSTLLILNQLITNIPTNPFDFEAKMEPYITPGGNALKFAYSLEIWLTRRKAKSAYRLGQHGEISGAEVKATIRKSRFGTEKRECAFDIEWGAKVGVADEESWLDVVLASERITRSGAWYSLEDAQGREFKFQQAKWMENLQDEGFRAAVNEILDYELIHKYTQTNVLTNVEEKMLDMAEELLIAKMEDTEE